MNYWVQKPKSLDSKSYTHTHTHTHIYIGYDQVTLDTILSNITSINIF